MPFNVSTGVYTAASGATNAATGQVIQSAVWNSVHTDFQTALTEVGTLVIPGNSNAVWNTYTPSITSGAGTFSVGGVTSGRYYQLGKAVFVELAASITTNGSASVSVISTLPLQAKQGVTNGIAIFGREDNVSGKMLQSYLSGSIAIGIVNYDNTYPAATGAVIRVGGTYEAL